MYVFTGPWVGSPCMAGDHATRIPRLSLAAAEPFVLGRRGRAAGAAFFALYRAVGRSSAPPLPSRVMLLFQVKGVGSWPVASCSSSKFS